MKKEQKSVYDKEYYKRDYVRLRKIARTRSLIRLSQKFPRYFKEFYEEELKKEKKLR